MTKNLEQQLVDLGRRRRAEEEADPYVPPPHNPPVLPDDLYAKVLEACESRAPCSTLNFEWRRYEDEEEHADWDRDKLVVDQVAAMLRAGGLAVHTPHKRWIPSKMVPYIGGGTPPPRPAGTTPSTWVGVAASR
jgi:hypothetical protein